MRSGAPSTRLAVATGATAAATMGAMPYTADQLQQELDRFNASLGLVTRRAGRGLDYDFERRLDAHRRMLSEVPRLAATACSPAYGERVRVEEIRAALDLHNLTGLRICAHLPRSRRWSDRPPDRHDA